MVFFFVKSQMNIAFNVRRNETHGDMQEWKELAGIYCI